MKYRKIPIVVDAYKFTGMESQLPDGVYHSSEGGFKLMTLEGPVDLAPTDMIVTGLAGERWCVKASIFKRSYEPCDETSDRKTCLMRTIGSSLVFEIAKHLNVDELPGAAIEHLASNELIHGIDEYACEVARFIKAPHERLRERILKAVTRMYETNDDEERFTAKHQAYDAIEQLVALVGSTLDPVSAAPDSDSYVPREGREPTAKPTPCSPLPDINCCFGPTEPTYLNESCDGFKWPTGLERHSSQSAADAVRPTGRVLLRAPVIDCPPCAMGDCTDPKHGW